MSGEPWSPLTAALDRAADQGCTIAVWLRDDDAVAPSPALARLTATCERHAMPVLLAVIPANAIPELAAFTAEHPMLAATQHGYSHANHAAPGERACELGGGRPLAAILDDLRRGRERLTHLFGSTAADILVPPWNRIDDAVRPALAGLGFRALSTFGPVVAPMVGIATLNTDLDIIDWRNGKVCRAHAALVQRLATLVDDAVARPHPIGLLTHHLIHDEAAWSFLDQGLQHLARHSAVRFASAADLCRPLSG